ncbi:MAG: CatB-related O-acetyltransferase [Formosimonas sp.]
MIKINTDGSDAGSLRVWYLNGCEIHVQPYTYGLNEVELHAYHQANAARLDIGRYCSLAAGTHIHLGGNHHTEWMSTFPFGEQFVAHLGGEEVTGQLYNNGNVKIGNDVWVGYGATILSGVTIGDGAVIAANAHVVKNVAPYEIVGGNPAKHIRYRFAPEIIELMLTLRWWSLPPSDVKTITSQLCAPPTVDGLRVLIERFKDVPRVEVI